MKARVSFSAQTLAELYFTAHCTADASFVFRVCHFVFRVSKVFVVKYVFPNKKSRAP
jgi:hypothetical protein